VWTRHDAATVRLLLGLDLQSHKIEQAVIYRDDMHQHILQLLFPNLTSSMKSRHVRRQTVQDPTIAVHIRIVEPLLDLAFFDKFPPRSSLDICSDDCPRVMKQRLDISSVTETLRSRVRRACSVCAIGV
jgi:hypothetical protein